MILRIKIGSWMVIMLAAAALGGCAASPSPGPPTTRPGGVWLPAVTAMCYPPTGWSPEPLKSSDRHAHQIWVSSTRLTAYGVIHFSLPLPLTNDMALWAFLRQMKQTEGKADLVSKQADPNLPGIHFIAVGGLYRLDGNLTVHGWDGWVSYGASLISQPPNAGELEQALLARDRTVVGPLHISASADADGLKSPD